MASVTLTVGRLDQQKVEGYVLRTRCNSHQSWADRRYWRCVKDKTCVDGALIGNVVGVDATGVVF